ncbi:DUF3558 domain-containing protein [Amycolatopsis sp. NPDC058986]|uniref:DUF3558 domain-containing protein n=1 Tax=unclassified Amycolatopsis TaxID=2618356 RepID=UPI00366D3461
MRSSIHRLVPLIGAAALALTACSTNTPGNAQPSSATASSTTSKASTPGTSDQIPGPGVPKVTDPIDFTPHLRTPCDALTREQVTDLLGENASAKTDLAATSGPTCTWRPPGTARTDVSINFFTAYPEGLTRIYRLRNTEYKFFMEVPAIGGHPAVAYGFADKRNTTGECLVAVGTSDTSVLNAGITLSDANIGKRDPCEIAQKVAGEALANIKGGR